MVSIKVIHSKDFSLLEFRTLELSCQLKHSYFNTTAYSDNTSLNIHCNIMKYIFLLLSLCLFSLTSGYLQRIPQISPKVYESRKQIGNFQLLKTNTNKSNLITRQLFLAPQIAFAASCAFAVFSYVYFNIDSIKAKQKIAVEKTMRFLFIYEHFFDEL